MYSSSRIRRGGVALATAAVLLATVPLVCPLLPRTVHVPMETRALATSALASAPRLLADVPGVLAFALLLVGGGLAFHAVWTADRDDRGAFGRWSGPWPEPRAAHPPSAPSTWSRWDSGGTAAGGGRPPR
jgi:hypothetical protein